jgi:hypothetical protein
VEQKQGIISNKETYTAKEKKLNDMVMSMPGHQLGVHHHVYKDNLIVV